jgi:RNA polymerase sigma-70 factor (ECF subfamily)
MHLKANRFTQDFNLLSSYLKGFAYKLTGDYHMAEDLYQETAFSAFKNRQKFLAGTNMKAWLCTIMKNSFINGFRKRQRRNTLNDNTSNNYWINSGSVHVLNDGESNVMEEELMTMIDQLDEKLKKPFLLSYNGFKYHEIAEEEGLPLGTIKSRIFMARKTLKEQVEQLALN